MHQNSLSAYRALDKEIRKEMVLKVFTESTCPLTDKQVMKILGFNDPNKVRPRITELIDLCELAPIEPGIRDEESGRTVRLVRLSTTKEKQEAEQRRILYEESKQGKWAFADAGKTKF